MGRTKEKWFVNIVVWRYFAVEENMTVVNTELSLCKWGETLILMFSRFFNFLLYEIQ